jgi:predicted regulator of amino acid metabolism with ACT domain
MWAEIIELFDDQPAKQETVKYLLKHGYSVDEDHGINANGAAITNTALAEQIGVDRRVVSETAEEILETPELREIFQNLSFIPFLEEAAPVLGLSVITVQVTDAKEPGLLAAITEVFADHDIMVRQAIVEDPYFTKQPQFVAIVDDTVPGELIIELDNLEFTTAVFYSSHDSL